MGAGYNVYLKPRFYLNIVSNANGLLIQNDSDLIPFSMFSVKIGLGYKF